MCDDIEMIRFLYLSLNIEIFLRKIRNRFGFMNRAICAICAIHAPHAPHAPHTRLTEVAAIHLVGGARCATWGDSRLEAPRRAPLTTLGRSTMEAIYLLRRLVEKYREKKKHLYMVFTDLQKVYNVDDITHRLG